MDKEQPRLERADGYIWLVIALLLPMAYLLASWAWERNELVNATAGVSPAPVAPVVLLD